MDFGITVVGAYILGKPLTGKALLNSMKDNPKTLTEKDLLGVVKKSDSFKQQINNIVDSNPNGQINIKNQELIFSGFNDLGLSLHGTLLNVSGNLVDGKGKLNVTITDYYDFKYENGYGDSLADTFITGYNNTAWKWQNIGTITPYNIVIQFDYEVK